MRPVGDIFTDDGMEIEVLEHGGKGCDGCYYDTLGDGCWYRNVSLTGRCRSDLGSGFSIIFKKHTIKTVKLDLTE